MSGLEQILIVYYTDLILGADGGKKIDEMA